jgi:ssDNA-binding Zn-finger/Zn-ribbon topoisomerase 1
MIIKKDKICEYCGYAIGIFLKNTKIKDIKRCPKCGEYLQEVQLKKVEERQENENQTYKN